MRKALVASLGGLGAAFLGALCCVGPLLFVTLGVGAGLASTFEPLRPWLGALMAVLFALAFYAAYGRRPAPVDAHGRACAAPRSRTRERRIVWTAFGFALLFWTFPTWSVWLL